MKWFPIYLNHVVHRVLKSPYSMFDCNSDFKFNDTCKPEKCSSGQPKYCLKKINTRCYQLCSSLWTFFKPNISPHVLKGESKTFLDSGFHGVDSGFQVLDPDTLSMELRFQLIARFRIPWAVCLITNHRILDFKAKRVGFRSPQVKLSLIPESGLSYMGQIAH